MTMSIKAFANSTQMHIQSTAHKEVDALNYLKIIMIYVSKKY